MKRKIDMICVIDSSGVIRFHGENADYLELIKGDMEKLEEITGSVVLAEEIVKQLGKYDIPPTEENVEGVMNAYDTIKQLKPLNDGAIKYMIRNHMEPTVDNIYRAQYSSSSDANKQGRGYFQDAAGYYAKKAEDFNWEQLQPQMEKVIAQLREMT